MDIWNYLKGLFDRERDSSPGRPYVREAMTRSEDDRADLVHWKRTRARERMLTTIHEAYADYLIAPDEQTRAIDFLNTPSSKGFVWHFSDTHDNEQDFQHLFDYLRERVLALGYIAQMSDVRTYQRTHWVETVQRHYLKPRVQFVGEGSEDMKAIQRFGNISVELLLRNERIANLKLRVNSYHDHKFEAAERFPDLMRHLLRLEVD